MTITASAQPSVRMRTRTGAAPTNVQPGATADWMQSGAAAIEGYERNREQLAVRREVQAVQREMPYRYSLKPGEEGDIVVLDADFGPSLYEHELTRHPRFMQNNPRTGYPKDLFVVSCKSFEPDPLAQFNEPYWCTFLTVIDMRSGMTRDNKPYANTKKLLCLKGDAMDMMVKIRQQRIAAGANPNAPLRGLQLLMRRSSEQRSLKTGLPMFVAHHDENAIMSSFSHPEVKDDRDGRVVKQANADCYAVDYVHLFPKPSAEAIAQRFQLEMPNTTGSAHANAQSWDRPANAQGGNGFAPSGGGIQPSGGGIQTSSHGVNNGGGIAPSAQSQGRPADRSWEEPETTHDATGRSSAAFSPDLDDEIPF